MKSKYCEVFTGKCWLAEQYCKAANLSDFCQDYYYLGNFESFMSVVVKFRTQMIMGLNNFKLISLLPFKLHIALAWLHEL